MCGITHNELIKTILSYDPIRLRTVNLNETRIKSNGRKRSPSKIQYAHPMMINTVQYPTAMPASTYQNMPFKMASGIVPDASFPIGRPVERKKKTLFRKLSERRVQQNFPDLMQNQQIQQNGASVFINNNNCNNNNNNNNNPMMINVNNNNRPIKAKNSTSFQTANNSLSPNSIKSSSGIESRNNQFWVN